MIFVQKKASYTCFHNHTVAASTWNYADHVKKNEYLTSKQAQKTLQTKNKTHSAKSFVAILKPKSPHKEQQPRKA
jgi:hypothetical protein